MEWYYVWWPWLTSNRVARVGKHQLSFLFVTTVKVRSSKNKNDAPTRWSKEFDNVCIRLDRLPEHVRRTDINVETISHCQHADAR